MRDIHSSDSIWCVPAPFVITCGEIMNKAKASEGGACAALHTKQANLLGNAGRRRRIEKEGRLRIC